MKQEKGKKKPADKKPKNKGLKMNELGTQPEESLPLDGTSQVEIEALIEQIWDDLGGVASRSDIRLALTEVAPEYESVRVKTYVPIFLRRDVIRRLQDRLTQYQGSAALQPE